MTPGPYILSLTTFLAIFICLYAKSSAPTTPTHQSIDVNKCRSIITAKKHPNGTPNHLSPLTSRALPNERLRIAFGIKNAFTSEDEDYTKRFVDHAKRLVNLGPAEWEEISVVLRDAVAGWMHSGEPRIKLTSMVQALSLRVILLVLFELRDGIGDEDLVNLAEAINRVWMQTKNTDTIPHFEENHELQECLSAIFPNQRSTNEDEGVEKNPLNLILPGFETLWRVVFRMFVEIAFTTGRQYPEWSDMLIAFSDNPTRAQFIQMHPDSERISPEPLVEALRLYPPTRRVYRLFSPHDDKIETLSADLEACHTATEIWGADARTFNPGRWAKSTSQQRRAFLPFGSTPFECPAKPVSGPRVIALVVGAVLRGLREDGGEWRVEGEGVDGGRLSNERGAYDDLDLVGCDVPCS